MSTEPPKGITIIGKCLIVSGVVMVLLAIAGFVAASGVPRNNEDELGKGIIARLSELILAISVSDLRQSRRLEIA